MILRAGVGWTVGITVLLVGCGTKTASLPAETGKGRVADAGRVTLHVKDMAKLLKLG
jgi:hypothetical protein